MARIDVSADQDDKSKLGKSCQRLFIGRTGPFGTLDMPLSNSTLLAGDYKMTVDVFTAIGEDHLTTPVQVIEKSQIMLVADKPVYQPGQKMHLRALVLDLGSRAAVKDSEITFEVEDARGNKVFKKKQ